MSLLLVIALMGHPHIPTLTNADRIVNGCISPIRAAKNNTRMTAKDLDAMKPCIEAMVKNILVSSLLSYELLYP